MKKTQPVCNHREKIDKLLYAVNYWLTLSERQQELIYDQMDW